MFAKHPKVDLHLPNTMHVFKSLSRVRCLLTQYCQVSRFLRLVYTLDYHGAIHACTQWFTAVLHKSALPLPEVKTLVCKLKMADFQ